MQSPQELCRLFETSPRYLRPEDVTKIRKVGFEFVDLYLSLHEEAINADVLQYHMLRKIHTYLHALDDLAEDRLNPRHYSGWTDESFMRFVIDMCKNKQTETLPSAVLQGWRGMVHDRWARTFS